MLIKWISKIEKCLIEKIKLLLANNVNVNKMNK